ncbi:hypothetical protein [Nonomuraea helvata]|uniref:Uncharacterized protein n=1 Tax=Nonomuraea helvata TaxID=37484 RepID=A0ABV5SA38_9ACTN
MAAVVAVAPGSIRHAGVTADSRASKEPAWDLKGQALPFIQAKMLVRTFFHFMSVGLQPPACTASKLIASGSSWKFTEVATRSESPT